METKNCPQCGNKMFHNIGVSKKNNKPYENYKCGACQYLEWVDQKGTTGKPKEPAWSGKILETEMLARIDANVQFIVDEINKKNKQD